MIISMKQAEYRGVKNNTIINSFIGIPMAKYSNKIICPKELRKLFFVYLMKDSRPLSKLTNDQLVDKNINISLLFKNILSI
jgi:hypothetical protein